MDRELIDLLYSIACEKTGGYGDIETARHFASLVARDVYSLAESICQTQKQQELNMDDFESAMNLRYGIDS